MQNNDLFDIYAYCIQHFPRRTFLEAADDLFTGKNHLYLDYNYPYKEFFYIAEDFDEKELTKDRKVANQIYLSLRKFILTNISKEEQEIFDLYKASGDRAMFAYDYDEQRKSTINSILNNQSFTLKTPYGTINIRFATREQYNASSVMLLGYEDVENAIVLFVKDPDNITTRELIDILRKRARFLHELQHYTDKILKHWIQTSYDQNNELEYINDVNELKAAIQEILYTFGAYLFKNQIRFKNYDFSNMSDIYALFNTFLIDKTENNVIDDEDVDQYRIKVYNLNAENKKELGRQLTYYIQNVYDTENDIDFTEAKKQYFIDLLRLEEKFYNE